MTMGPFPLPEIAVLDYRFGSAAERSAVIRGLFVAGYTRREIAEGLPAHPNTVRKYAGKPGPLTHHYEDPPERFRLVGGPPKAPLLEGVPPRELAELRRLHELTSKVRGWTAPDARERKAIPDMGALLIRLTQEYGVGLPALSRHLGLTGPALDLWLRRHDFGVPNYPSQRTYGTSRKSLGGT